MQAFLDYLPEELVAIRNEDWPAIHKAIADAVAPLKPRGWRKAVFIIRELGPIIGTVAVVVALLAIVVTLGIFTSNGITKNAEFRTHTEDRLTTIEGTLAKINATLDGTKLKQTSSNPASLESITEAKNVLTAAVANKTKIDPTIVKDAGVKFVEASQNAPAAWDAALAFLNYKSFLNSLASGSPISDSVGPIMIESTKYNIPEANVLEPFREHGQLTVPSNAPNIPQFRSLRAPNPNENTTVGPSFLVFEGGVLLLDGLYLKRIVFRNTHIVYHGEPITLDNVFFIDCTFEIDLKPGGLNFADTFLKSGPSTTFAAG